MTDPGATAGASGDPVTTSEAAVRHELQLRYDHAQLPGDPCRGAGLARRGAPSHRAAGGRLVHRRRRCVGLSRRPSSATSPGAEQSCSCSWACRASCWRSCWRDSRASRGRRRCADTSCSCGHVARPVASWPALLVGSEVLIAFLGAIVGLVLGAALAFALFGAELLSIDPLARLGWAAVLVLPLVTLLAVLAAGSSLRALMADAVSTGRQEVQRASRPLWQRLYLDVGAPGRRGGDVFRGQRQRRPSGRDHGGQPHGDPRTQLVRGAVPAVARRQPAPPRCPRPAAERSAVRLPRASARTLAAGSRPHPQRHVQLRLRGCWSWSRCPSRSRSACRCSRRPTDSSTGGRRARPQRRS